MFHDAALRHRLDLEAHWARGALSHPEHERKEHDYDQQIGDQVGERRRGETGFRRVDSPAVLEQLVELVAIRDAGRR